MGTVTPLRADRRYSALELRTGAYSILREGRLELRRLHRGAASDRVMHVDAVVHGHTGDHEVLFVLDVGWSCSCPVESLCHHITAAELVTHAVTPAGSAARPK